MSAGDLDPRLQAMEPGLNPALPYTGWLTPSDFEQPLEQTSLGYHAAVIMKLIRVSGERLRLAEGDPQAQERERALGDGHMQRLLEGFVRDSAHELFGMSNRLVGRVMGPEQVESVLRLESERDMLPIEERAAFPGDQAQRDLLEEYREWRVRLWQATGGVIPLSADLVTVPSTSEGQLHFSEYEVGVDGSVTALEMQTDLQRLHELDGDSDDWAQRAEMMRFEARIDGDPRRVTDFAELHGVLVSIDSTTYGLMDLEELSQDELRQRLVEPPELI